jgi:integrase
MPKAKPKTVRNDVVLLKQLTNFAVRRRMIRHNPLADLTIEQPPRTPQPFWMRYQVEQILHATSRRYGPLFHFLADTGSRIAEACWLTWEDVDLENKVVHIRPKEGWKPKTGDQRTVPLSTELCQILTQLPRNSMWVFTAPPTVRFPTSDRQVSPRRALAHLKVVLKKLRLPGHLHTFRHSFISHALTSGVPPAIVKVWVGHVDDEILRLYTHIADQQSRSAIDKMLPGKEQHCSREGAGAGI